MRDARSVCALPFNTVQRDSSVRQLMRPLTRRTEKSDSVCLGPDAVSHVDVSVVVNVSTFCVDV